MLNLRQRAHMDELLDQPDVPQDELERSLTDLEVANRWLGGRNALFKHVMPVLPQASRVLDVACGSADMLRAVSQAGKKTGESLSLTGIDINPRVLAVARARTQGYPGITLVQGDALDLPFADDSFDITISSMFLHHLDPQDAVRALREAARVSRKRVVFVDLIRSFAAWLGVASAGKILFGRISQHDGPVSVRRAYTPLELRDLAGEAGLTNSRVYTGLIRMALVYDKGES